MLPPTANGKILPISKDCSRVSAMSLNILSFLAIVFSLKFAGDILIPLIFSILISFALNPFVNGLTRLKIPRIIAVALLLSTLIGAIAFGTYNLRDQAIDILEQLPKAAQKLTRSLRAGQSDPEATLTKVQRAATEIEKAAAAATADDSVKRAPRVSLPTSAVFSFRDFLLMGSKSILAFGGIFILCLFLIFFLLLSGDLFKRKIVHIAGPTLTHKKITLQVIDEITQQINRYLQIQLVSGAIVGLLTWLAFLWIGLEQAALWGVIAGILNIVPYIGPVIVGGGTAVVAYMQFGTLSMTLLVSGVGVLITSLEGYLLMPWLSSRASRMNPLSVFLALMFFGWLWGAWGFLLGVPIIMVVKVICTHVENWRPVAELLNN